MLTDRALPEIDVCISGEGFRDPAAEQAANESFSRSIRAAENGLHRRECGGLIYLGRSLRGWR